MQNYTPKTMHQFWYFHYFDVKCANTQFVWQNDIQRADLYQVNDGSQTDFMPIQMGFSIRSASNSFECVEQALYVGIDVLQMIILLNSLVWFTSCAPICGAEILLASAPSLNQNISKLFEVHHQINHLARIIWRWNLNAFYAKTVHR